MIAIMASQSGGRNVKHEQITDAEADGYEDTGPISCDGQTEVCRIKSVGAAGF